MGVNQLLKSSLVKEADFARVAGIGLVALSGCATLFSDFEDIWPLNGFTLTLAAVSAAGLAMLWRGQRLVRILMGFGSMEAPPISLNQTEK